MKLLGLDIETTGLDQEKGHRIVEIAAILYDSESEKKLLEFTQRINPQRSIDPGAQAVHHISFEDVSGCPTWEEVAPKVLKILQASNVVIAHNGMGFDIPFIAGELRRIGKEVPVIEVFDTMVAGRWSTVMGKVPNLGELCFATGTEYDVSKAHAATYDVEVMMSCFFKGRAKGFFNLGKGD